jgi:hypothetical protein
MTIQLIIKGLQLVCSYNTANWMLSTPPKSELHSWKEKRANGVHICHKMGRHDKSTIFVTEVQEAA